MERTLRESDDGILVYVAPTKALVAQISAEIYARFSKELQNGGCSLETESSKAELIRRYMLGCSHSRLSRPRPAEVPNFSHSPGNVIHYDAVTATGQKLASQN
jgi:hypothetical protein